MTDVVVANDQTDDTYVKMVAEMTAEMIDILTQSRNDLEELNWNACDSYFDTLEAVFKIIGVVINNLGGEVDEAKSMEMKGSGGNTSSDMTDVVSDLEGICNDIEMGITEDVVSDNSLAWRFLIAVSEQLNDVASNLRSDADDAQTQFNPVREYCAWREV